MCQRTENLKKVLPLVKVCRDLNPDKSCDSNVEADIMKNGKANYIGKGVHRRVYGFRQGINSCVVKLPKEESSKEFQLKEINTYKEAPENIKHLYNPITEYDENGDWLIQPKVKTFGDREGYRVADILHQILKENGVWCKDLHDENVGITKEGKYVIIDYGFGTCRRE